MGGRCQVVYQTLFGALVCGSIEACRHVRSGPAGDVIVVVCHACWARVVALGRRFDNGTVEADHPVDLPCLLPEGEWGDDGCTLPIPDTAAELADDLRAVPA